ncbi:MAG TPA: LysR substrate-binding domain-containing protein [Polyangia bacterium]
MDRLTSMAVFVATVERGGFAAAAARFAISPAMASKHLRALEERVGVKLLHRTTRRRSLTETGRVYFDRCKAILAAVEAAESNVSGDAGAVRGTLRVTAPVTFGARRLAPALVDFMRLHPEVRIELMLNDRVVDLIDEEFDVAIRIGHLGDSTLMARPLAPYRVRLCASPSYLAGRRAPRTLADLARHTCLGFTVARGRDTWQGLDKRGAGGAPIDVRLSINNGEALRQAALAGGGIILQPEVLVADDLRSGRLRPVLTSFEPAPRPMHVLYLPDRAPPGRVRRFVDFVARRFAAGTERARARGSRDRDLRRAPELEIIRVIDTPKATHIRYRVRR